MYSREKLKAKCNLRNWELIKWLQDKNPNAIITICGDDNCFMHVEADESIITLDNEDLGSEECYINTEPVSYPLEHGEDIGSKEKSLEEKVKYCIISNTFSGGRDLYYGVPDLKGATVIDVTSEHISDKKFVTSLFLQTLRGEICRIVIQKEEV